MKTFIGYSHLLVNMAGALLSGVLGAAFVLLAFYLAYTSINETPGFRVKHLMMPTMNLLISSVLFYYCRFLFTKGATVNQSLAANTYTPPLIQATLYDIFAIIGFIAFAVLLFFFFF